MNLKRVFRRTAVMGNANEQYLNYQRLNNYQQTELKNS